MKREGLCNLPPLVFRSFFVGIVNHSRIRGAVHDVRVNVRKKLKLVVVVLISETVA